MQQGDPLGPLGFALTLHPLMEHIQAEATSLELNTWFLDDGTLIGPPSDLSSALNIVEKRWASMRVAPESWEVSPLLT